MMSPHRTTRYTGETGRVCATLRRVADAPELLYGDGSQVGQLAADASTAGRFGLFRWDLAPGQRGPRPHFHRDFSVSLYVLSGTVRLFDGWEWCRAIPGDFQHVPEGGLHSFANHGDEPASLLALFAPSSLGQGCLDALMECAWYLD